MTDSVFQWFWQPPINGQPGIIMVADYHPGPEAIEVPFVIEDLDNVLTWVEARIDPTLTLHMFRIYMRDVLNHWGQIAFKDTASRKYIITPTEIQQAELSELWDTRLAADPDFPRRLDS